MWTAQVKWLKWLKKTLLGGGGVLHSEKDAFFARAFAKVPRAGLLAVIVEHPSSMQDVRHLMNIFEKKNSECSQQEPSQ